MVQVTERELEGARQPVTEQPSWFLPGVRMLLLSIVVILVGVAVAVGASHLTGAASDGLVLLTVLIELCGALMLAGLTPVSPGHARVIQLFGRYCGTSRDTSLKWGNPFTKRVGVSSGLPNKSSTPLTVDRTAATRRCRSRCAGGRPTTCPASTPGLGPRPPGAWPGAAACRDQSGRCAAPAVRRATRTRTRTPVLASGPGHHGLGAGVSR